MKYKQGVSDFTPISGMKNLLFALSSAYAQFIPVISNTGTVQFSVNVDGAVDNPQSVCLDTGSKHSYLISHEVMQQVLQRRRLPPERRGTGLRDLRLTPDELSLEASANDVRYLDETQVQLSHWRSRRFTTSEGGHHWDQKFAVATLSDGGQIDRWDPNRSGLVGASPDSRFARAHPNFGFAPRPTFDRTDYSFFITPIRPEWCRETRVVYSTIIQPPNVWKIEASRVSLGRDFIVLDNIPAVIDTGCSVIYFPAESYDLVKAYLNSLNIPSLVLPPPEHPLRFPTVTLHDILMVPDLFVTLQSTGATIRIPKERIVVCFDADHPCRISIGGGEYPNIIIGGPLFSSMIVEFDTAGDRPRIGFCEPRDIDQENPPLITLGDPPENVRPVAPSPTGDGIPTASPPTHQHTSSPAIIIEPAGVVTPLTPTITEEGKVPSSTSSLVVSKFPPKWHTPGSNIPSVELPEPFVPLRIPNDVVEDSDDDDESSSSTPDDTYIKGAARESKGAQNHVVYWTTVLFISNFIIAQ